MTSLYELTGELLRLLEMAEDPDMDEQALKDTMEAVEGEFEFKADGYAKVMMELDAKIAMLTAEKEVFKSQADRLDSLIKSVKANKDKMNRNLFDSMVATGKTKFKTDLFNFSIKKNPAALKIADDVDVNLLPPQYLKFKDPEIDKDEVKKAIKAGESFDWAEMVQTERLEVK